MNAHITLHARLLARVAGRSLPIRRTRRLAPTPPVAIGLAVIRVAGDDRLQAVAVGPFPDPPAVVTLLDPDDRHQPGLEQVGAVLHQHLHPAGIGQVWVPDAPSLAALAVEGERSRRNPQLSPGRQQFGIWCFALSQLARLPGQQVVAVATEVLASHLITGQSLAEDAHLGARLSWDAPRPGLAPDQVSTRRQRHPGPTLLPVAADERVERLRTRVRRGTASPGEIRELERILYRAAWDAWGLLVQAREVYRTLPFPPLPGLEDLVAASGRELARLLAHPTLSRHSLAATRAAFLRQETWRARLEDVDARGDPVQRDLLRRQGRVLATTILRVRPGALGQPVRILLHTGQPVLRIRPGTRLTTEDARVTAVVDVIRHRPGGALLVLRVTSGVRAARALPTNQVLDWFDTVIFAGRPGGTGSHLPGIPPAVPVQPIPVSGSLLPLARRLRRP
jgi:hypothetical protein